MELNAKQKGNLTELQCLTAFYKEGCHVSIPFGENSRYDMIVDIKGKLIKVQVKTSSLKNGDPNVIEFSCRSTRVNCKGTKTMRYTKEEIDYFATYWNNKCYLIPVTECSVTKTLRFAPPKNGQKVGVSFAKDYELNKQLQIIRGGSN